MTDKQPWFSEEAGFFGPNYLVEYEETLPNERTIIEVDFVEKTLNLKPGTKILDVHCGHGRHAIELAKRGYDVTGYELNQFFLSEAEKATKEADVSVHFLQGDMRELAFDAEFDVALNLFTAMGYFDKDEDDVAFLAGVYKSLKSGGQFLIDFINRDWLIRNFREKDWRELPDGSLLVIERLYEPILGRNTDRRTKVTKDGVMTDSVGSALRIYTANELVKMAENVGFTFKEAFGDFEGNPLKLDSRRTILHFEKK